MKDNFVTSYSKHEPSDNHTIFQDEGFVYTDARTIEQLAFECGAYASKGEARRAGRVGLIPSGYSEMWVNKKRKIYIWNPTLSLKDCEQND